MRVIAFVALYPLAQLYSLGVLLHKCLYYYHLLPRYQSPCIVIGIGNLRVGGTGKTPMVAYILELLLCHFPPEQLAIVSAGYRRNTRGLRLATTQDTPQTIGDEPYQLYLRYPQVRLCLCRNFPQALRYLADQSIAPKVVLIDDAMQAVRIQLHCLIALSTYAQPFWRDYPLPLGWLREPRSGLKQAQALCVTKCPALSPAQQHSIRHRVRPYLRSAVPVFFSSIHYMPPLPFGKPQVMEKNLILITGIAQSNPIKTYLEEQHHIIHHFRFWDHYRYTLATCQRIAASYHQTSLPCSIITTEKDFVKLQVCLRQVPALQALPWFYLPMRLQLTDDFKAFILQQARYE